MIVNQPECIFSDHYIAAVGEIAAGFVMNTLFVNDRIPRPNHGAELMAMVIDREINVRIGILGT